ncbi:MAG: 1-phosphofructokinase family hexose kinase [Propioniciclava sp.]
MTQPRTQTRVVTFTANPSIDQTVALRQRLQRGELQRADEVTEQAAGKGINVAQVLSAAGCSVTMVIAGMDADYRDRLAGFHLPWASVDLDAGQRVRVNLTLTEPDGTTTKINEPGPTLTPAQVAASVAQLTEACRGAVWAVLTGSLPPGAPRDWYVHLIAAIRPLGCRIAVDTSERPLLEVTRARSAAHIDLLKPNAAELAQLTGGNAAQFEAEAARGDVGAIVAAGRALHQVGIAQVLVTLGAAGAVLVNASGAWQAWAPWSVVRSTVGAGDSAVAGFVLAAMAGASSADCLARAVAYGTAAAALPGSRVPRPADLTPDMVRVQQVGESGR